MQQPSRRPLILVVATAWLIGVVGCWRSAPVSAPAPRPNTSASHSNSAPPADSAVAQAASHTAVSETAVGAAARRRAQPVTEPGIARPSSGAGAASGSESVAAEPGPLEPTFATERILLLAPLNPLIIEFQLSIDGQPHTAALERLVAEVLKMADADGDGRTTWHELAECKRIKYGQYGNLPIEGDNGEKQIIDRYDIDRDKIVDEIEVPRFLTRNAGAARPFSIRGTLDHRDLNRRSAATWRILDADDDGAISAAERAAAPARLASRDTNDDEILLTSDLDPRLEAPDPELMSERRRRGPDAARLLGPHADWGSVQLALEHAYAGSRSVRADSFPLTPELFASLDKNYDGRLQRDEYPRLNEVRPHLVIAVEFGSDRSPHAPREESRAPSRSDGRRSETPTQPRLRLVSIASGLGGSGESVVTQPGRLTIPVAGVLLTLYTNDTVASDDFAARAKQVLEMYDANKDGYLEKSEVPESLQAQFARFEAVDADEDGKAYPAEIEAFLAQQQVGLRAQIHAKASDREDVLFAALDADHDERLDSREVEGTPQRLGLLDRNGDGLITPDELPEVMVIGLARGSLENAEALFTPPPVIVRGPDAKAPRWFTAMDANRDGAISRREFLGPPEKFAELDKDGNGLLELGEVVIHANP